MAKAAAEQRRLLTLAELSVMLNLSYGLTGRYAREWAEEKDELLPLKGYRMDQGSGPTHKKEIVRLYEQGVAPPDIARQTGHSLKSVERHLTDYERVRMLLKRGAEEQEIRTLTGLSQWVVVV